MTFKKGDQIAYVPNHVQQLARAKWIGHNDTELGFVWQDEDNTVLCRYWSKSSPGTLRTRSCSERCDKPDLIPHISMEVSYINYWLKVIEKERASDMPKLNISKAHTNKYLRDFDGRIMQVWLDTPEQMTGAWYRVYPVALAEDNDFPEFNHETANDQDRQEKHEGDNSPDEEEKGTASDV